MFYHWLIGMDVKPLNWKTSDLTLWLLSISSVYLLCGRAAERENGPSKYYKIIRFGRVQSFWREVCVHQIKLVFLFVFFSFWMVAGLSYIAEVADGNTNISMHWEKLAGGAVLFGLNHSIMGMAQALIILAFGHANIVFMAMMLFEIVSLFFSSQAFIGWNPFNWDMVFRTDIYANYGFDFWIITVVQMILFLVILLGGDRVLKKKVE